MKTTYKDAFLDPPDEDCEIACLHCMGIFRSKDMKLEKRFNCEFLLWWCPDSSCDGGGFKHDLFPTAEPFGAGIKAGAKKARKIT